MKYLIIGSILFMCTGCKQKGKPSELRADSKAEQQVMPGYSLALDSAAFYQTFILGRWYIPGDPNLAMEIRTGEIDFGEGMLVSPYRFNSLHQLILTSTDGSADTVAIRISRDTLFVKSNTEKREAPYVRRP